MMKQFSFFEADDVVFVDVVDGVSEVVARAGLLRQNVRCRFRSSTWQSRLQ
jgi:hypothetical protein